MDSHTSTSPARPDLYGHERSIQPMEIVVKELRGLLGAPLVAYLASVQETRAVHEWAEGKRAVGSNEKQRRLRIALQVASLLSVRDTPEVVQAWFQGLNPQLADRSPARLLRDGDPDEVGPEIINAARNFSAVG